MPGTVRIAHLRDQARSASVSDPALTPPGDIHVLDYLVHGAHPAKDETRRGSFQTNRAPISTGERSMGAAFHSAVWGRDRRGKPASLERLMTTTPSPRRAAVGQTGGASA